MYVIIASMDYASKEILSWHYTKTDAQETLNVLLDQERRRREAGVEEKYYYCDEIYIEKVPSRIEADYLTESEFLEELKTTPGKEYA